MAATPTRRLVRARVACALRSGLDGDERLKAERWLGGLRRLDSYVVPFAGTIGKCERCAGRMRLTSRGWRCSVCGWPE